ncbi:fumarylacetoacetase [Rhodococcus sp. UNC363MFTsu5.1]|uniref:fumarylacetoacetase n=1 Tax=Rhodococcus sp. UNC363MFTsu5.1 TaxID=1449069 RepID=UPI00068E54E7|nr:fumarylacetoacetase [Rhodococcus sp. UNC363MFTsu5.1]
MSNGVVSSDLQAVASGLDLLPYGVFSTGALHRHIGVAIGDHVLDLTSVVDEAALRSTTLNAFLALGRARWAEVRTEITELLSDPAHRQRVQPYLHPLSEAQMHLPFDVADYVDFYASEPHATNLGRMFRPGQPPLPPNWKHLPIGYHGRAGTVVPSGTAVVRPTGQRKAPDEQAPTDGPTRRLDFEVELGYVVGIPSDLGTCVRTDDFADHVFGVVLLNDWSARDLQSWEYVPLGPFLGKSFATSISPWVVPLAALEAARRPGAAQDPGPLEYLRETENWGLDIEFEVELNGQVISRPPYRGMYWSPAQMLAHLTANGARLRTGDLFASGTVSGPGRDQVGSLIELTDAGREPITLSDGSTRAFLEDGDVVTIAATAPSPAGGRFRLGEVTGTILPAVPRTR